MSGGDEKRVDVAARGHRMHRRKDGRTRVRAARRRWRWSCPANIGESDDSRRKMSDGRVVEDVSGVEWDNKRTNDRDRPNDRGAYGYLLLGQISPDTDSSATAIT